MSDSEESDFDFDIDAGDISLPIPKKTRNIGERKCAWTFQDRWHCSHTTVGAEIIEDRRTNTIQEFREKNHASWVKNASE